MFGWREGKIGTQMAALLERKLAEGVEVRALVDVLGSRPLRQARAMFTRLVEAGAEIVVNDVLPVDRHGLYPDERRFDWRQDELGHSEHRKLYVVDGAVAWTGGAGLEDHFRDGRFHDAPVIPRGFIAASQAIEEQIDGARERLDVMNPYITDRGMLERILAAAARGVKVRIIVAKKSNNSQASAALRHRYADLTAAGVEVWELPGTVVHAKVVIADDVVSFGTVNLDAWALYRNSELTMISRSPELAAVLEERLFEPDIARSARGEASTAPRERIEGWLWGKLSSLL
jgi:cardiolipin synthase